MIPFNRQNLFGNELRYIEEAYKEGKVSGDGKFTKLCTSFMERRFKARKVMLTTSCTHALELSSLLIDMGPGDEVIMPSYTFVSTANAIVLRGAKPVFCDIKEQDLNMDETKIPELVTDRTKAIVPVHYAGVPCEMDEIMKIAKENDLFVVEDAAQGVDVRYSDKYLGTIGDIGCYSFHETKNFSAGEGGAIVINNPDLLERAEIIRDKGTNRSQFFRGEVDKYSWVDLGSSFLPSELNAAVLFCQFENMDIINERRSDIYARYHRGLFSHEENGHLSLPLMYEKGQTNHHMFYIILNTNKQRDELMFYLRRNGINSVFHYIPLHSSPFYTERYGLTKLPVTEDLSGRILRLPIYYSLKDDEVDLIIERVVDFLSV